MQLPRDEPLLVAQCMLTYTWHFATVVDNYRMPHQLFALASPFNHYSPTRVFVYCQSGKAFRYLRYVTAAAAAQRGLKKKKEKK